MASFRIRTALLSLTCVVGAACGGDGTGPSTVASVRVEPASPTLSVGEDVQLTAVALDGSGDPIADKIASWSSSATGVASVSTAGMVEGVAAGSAQITATIDGKSGSTQVTVIAAGTAPELTSVAPGTIPVGGTATVTGTGFTSGTRVYVNGVRATVTGTTTSSITITVPCIAPGPGSVTASNGTAVSTAIQTTVTASAATNMAVGEFRLLSEPQCLQLGASATSQQYLVGVQSTHNSVSVLTPVTFGIDVAGGGTVTSYELPVGMRAQSITGLSLPAVASATSDRWQEHRTAEHSLRARELEQMSGKLGASRLRGIAAASGTALLSAAAEVGDTVDFRYPDPDLNLCDDYVPVTGVVRHISTRAIFVNDVKNPEPGYSAADYQYFGTLLDNRIYATAADYFGDATDYDENGRIIVLFTQEVNQREGILGMVVSSDLFPRTGDNSCPASDEGEIYYGRAPDPTGTVGQAYPLEDARLDAPSVIAHELTHIIQFGRRIETPGATSFQQLWELESQAIIGEEVVGHDFTGRTTGQNYGYDVAFENCTDGATDIAWYCDKFSDLAVYFGFLTRQTRADGAPEQCSWLGRENNGPCIPNRLIYTGWSFLRWLSDHYGAQLGGEQQLHRRMIANTTVGFQSIEQIIGQPIDQLLGRWAASLYVDDRYAGMDPLLTLPSWNLYGISQRLVETAQLRPYLTSFTDYNHDVSVRSASTAYHLVTGARPASAVRATSQTGAALPGHMRMWVVRVQ